MCAMPNAYHFQDTIDWIILFLDSLAWHVLATSV